MQITNLNSLTITIFIIILLWWSILLYSFLKKRERLKAFYLLLFNQTKTYYIKYLFLFLSLITVSLWILNIKYWEKTNKQEVNWIDIVYVVDVSKSMNALDFKDGRYSISRLDFTKALISNNIANNPENRYWLVIFAGDAVSSSPLTTDHSTFLTFLKNVDYRNLTKQWTNLEKAVQLWVERLYANKSDDDRAKALILLSDWWDEWEEVDYEYIKWLVSSKNVSSFVIWIWKTTGTKIPVWQDFFWNISYQQYQWQDVVTKLNNNTLNALTTSLDWEYIIANSVEDLEKISLAIESLEKKAIEVAGWENKKDSWRILGMISVIFFVVYLLLGTLLQPLYWVKWKHY